MLNEIWKLCQALDKANIKTDNISHPLIHPLSRSEKNLLRIRLSEDGHVSSVEYIDDVSGLWRFFSGTSAGSFPIIKVNQSFLKLSPESTEFKILSVLQKKENRDKLSMIEIKAENCRSWKQAGHDWTGSFKNAKIIREELKEYAQCKSIVDLAERFQKALEISEDINTRFSASRKIKKSKINNQMEQQKPEQQKDVRFIYEICDFALRQIQAGNLIGEKAIKTIQELLIGKKDKKGKEKNISVMLVLELDTDESIYKENIKRAIDDNCPTDLTPERRAYQHFADSSAFGGNGNLLKEPFPKVNLRFLGNVPLISMAGDKNDDGCNKRYGLTGYTICPVTKSQSRYMKKALEWLLHEFPVGTTWRAVANGAYDSVKGKKVKKKEKSDLLIVFLDEQPKKEAPIANLFGSDQDSIEDQFEVDAKAVSDALKGIVKEHPDSHLNLFLIRKVNNGQAQVVLSRFLIAQDVLMKVEQWQQAVRENTPYITLDIPPDQDSKTKKILISVHPVVPYPDQIVRLLSSQWTRDGSSPLGADKKPQKAKHEAIGPSFGEVIDLMLRAEGKWEPAARRMMNLLIQRITPLLIGVFGAKHSGGSRYEQQIIQEIKEPVFEYPRESRQIALQAAATMGILLDALKSGKEKYMKEAPFQIGKVLAMADALHKQYCIVVREGQLPNSLIGTSLMRRALDSPAGALADLSERIVEYVRWAKVAKVSPEWHKDATGKKKIEAIEEVEKVLKQYQPLMDSLSECVLPTECDDIMKAQLLLGFMSS